MNTAKRRLRLGFFTRVLDETDAAERYRFATEQILHAERHGFDVAWVAQHHFHADEGGLPAPLVFLAQAAVQARRIKLGTGIITLPMELPIRVAEDAAVLDLMCGGRLELGIGSGGTPSSYAAFGLDFEQRGAIMASHTQMLRDAWGGRELPGGHRLYPAAPGLLDRMWQASFTVEGARRAGLAGDGLMLSRTQPRPADAPDLRLDDIQNPMIDAYLAALPPGRAPRIMASRSVFVTENRAEALRYAEIGLHRFRTRLESVGRPVPEGTLEEQIKGFDMHLGGPEEVIASLKADTVLQRATELSVQVHSVDPPHPLTLRSIQLVAEEVAPALGWAPEAAEDMRHVA